MPNHGAASQSLARAIAAEFRYRWRHGLRPGRRDTCARLDGAELSIQRLGDRVDSLLEVLAQLCDDSGQLDVADDFRALLAQAAASPARLRLVQGDERESLPG